MKLGIVCLRSDGIEFNKLRDKLDMIWDKRKEEPTPEPVIVETPEEEYARILKESSMTAEQAYE